MRKPVFPVGRISVTTQIHKDQSMALGESVGERAPVPRGASESMQEDQGLAATGLLVVHLNVADLNDMPLSKSACHGYPI
jgi:hypothetical protein